jgi:hypothetical protein
VPDRRQKLRVHPRQRLRVGPVVLLHSRSGEFRAAAQRIRETLARPVERALPRGVVLAGGAHRALSLRLRILD